MLEPYADITGLRIGLAGAVKDIEINAKVIDKLAEAVEKIEIMNQSLCKMIALHELKHDSAEKLHGEIDADFKELSTRIDTLVTLKHEARAASPASEVAELKKLIDQLNKWKYIATGALLVIGYLLSHLEHFGVFVMGLLK